MVAQELLTFIDNLDGITSVVKSDHILNLFADLEGRLPDNKGHILTMLRTYLAMDLRQQQLYQLGRRLGIFHRIGDFKDPHSVAEVEKAYHALDITPENVDEITHALMTRYL